MQSDDTQQTTFTCFFIDTGYPGIYVRPSPGGLREINTVGPAPAGLRDAATRTPSGG